MCYAGIHDLQQRGFWSRDILCSKKFCCRKGGAALQGPERGLLSNTQKRIVWGDTCWQSKRLYWERSTWAESSRVREPRSTALPRGPQSRVLPDEISFGWSLANHSDSESFLVVHAPLSQYGCQRERFWEVGRHAVSPFDLSQTLPVDGGLLVPYSLSGPPVLKQLMQIVTREPGQGGRFQWMCFP